MVTASPSLRFKPFPDPPSYEFSLVEGFSFITPLEPPDPPDVVYLFAPLQILNTSAKPSLQEFTQTFILMLVCPTMVTKLNGGGAPKLLCRPVTFLSPMDVYFLWYTCLIVETRTGLLSDLITTFLFRLLVRFSRFTFASLLDYLYYVEGVGMKVVWNTLDMCSLVLVDDVLMDRFSFSSTLVRSLPAVCRFFVVSSLAFGAVILFSSSWWQLEKKLIGMFHLVNMLLMDTDFWVVSCLEQFFFPIFLLVRTGPEGKSPKPLIRAFDLKGVWLSVRPVLLLVWSELEVHVLLVLKGSSFQLTPISAFGAVIVILWITLDANIQEVYEIVMQFL